MITRDVLTLKQAAESFGISERTMFRWVYAGFLRPVGRRQRGKLLLFSEDAVTNAKRRIESGCSPYQVQKISSIKNLSEILERCNSAWVLASRATDMALDAVEILWKDTNDPKALELLRCYKRITRPGNNFSEKA